MPTTAAAGAPAAAAPLAAPSRPLPDSLSGLFRGFDPAHAAAARVQPRGLLNPGNLCFVNSILQVGSCRDACRRGSACTHKAMACLLLRHAMPIGKPSHPAPLFGLPQALLGSSRFCSLLGVLRGAATDLDPAATPTLAALAALASEFPTLQQAAAGQAVASADEAAGKAAASLSVLLGGQPFLPDMLLDVVSAFRPVAHPSGGGAVVLGAGRSTNGVLAMEVSREGMRPTVLAGDACASVNCHFCGALMGVAGTHLHCRMAHTSARVLCCS